MSYLKLNVGEHLLTDKGVLLTITKISAIKAGDKITMLRSNSSAVTRVESSPLKDLPDGWTVLTSEELERLIGAGADAAEEEQ